ncbi:DUF6318 family protein [Brachybacterium subflavum]|uniref:DUF6318 family protein n=1 Tax=Brachybacterium subflavum TaxID=2585206 RepID=UPI0012663B9E|nr:DUF6318 family protein [Brachybacterium subflavum]
MTTTRRTLSSLAVLALAAGLMTGCGDKDEPSPSAGSEATASAPEEQSDGGGESAKPTKSDVPKPDPKDYPGMDERTDEGAEQAFRYFWALVVWGHETGDSSAMQEHFSEECDVCARFAGDIERIDKNSTQWSEGGIGDNQLYSDSDNKKYDVVVSYSFVIKSHNEPVAGNSKQNTVSDSTVLAIGGLDWRDDAWIVRGVKTDVQD